MYTAYLSLVSQNQHYRLLVVSLAIQLYMEAWQKGIYVCYFNFTICANHLSYRVYTTRADSMCQHHCELLCLETMVPVMVQLPGNNNINKNISNIIDYQLRLRSSCYFLESRARLGLRSGLYIELRLWLEDAEFFSSNILTFPLELCKNYIDILLALLCYGF